MPFEPVPFEEAQDASAAAFAKALVGLLPQLGLALALSNSYHF